MTSDVNSGKVENPRSGMSRASVSTVGMAEVTRWLGLLYIVFLSAGNKLVHMIVEGFPAV